MIGIPSRLFRRGSWIGLVLLVSMSARSALAEPSIADKTTAETLFAEGKKQLRQKRYDEACKSFSESQRLDPGVGTLLNLAVCYEKQGKLASAWTIYREAAAAARASKQTSREQMARKGADALEPRLAKLTIVPPTGDLPPQMQILRDGEVVPQSLWGVAAAVDPGTHQLEVTAPGREKWSTKVAANVGQSSTVTVPALKPVASPAPARAKVATTTESTPAYVPPPSDDAPAPAGRTQKIIGGIAVGTGVVVTAVGAYFGGKAISTYRGAECDDANKCTQAGLDAQDKGIAYSTTATVAVTGGLLVIATGVVLWLTAPSPQTASANAVRSADQRRIWITGSPVGETRSVAITGTF
jgi:serine/threonine-protein kinase